MLTRTRVGEASWRGDLREGAGWVQSETHAVSATYGLRSRWNSSEGTNPEELLASAHAACFTIMLVALLTAAGTAPSSLKTRATVTLQHEATTSTISEISLSVEGTVAGIDQATFARQAQIAKASCPLSRALTGVPTLRVRAVLQPFVVD